MEDGPVRDFRNSYLSMLEVLCETFGFELYDYQKEILLDRMVFEKQIAEREDSFRKKIVYNEGIGKTCDVMIHDELS